jgi:uncharacterized protein DUF3500/5'-nucleotidase-like protein
MNRRRVLQGLGALAGAGTLGRFALLPPSASRTIAPADQLAARFFDSLDDQQRAEACVPYDHPLRQLHNKGLWTAGLLASPLALGWTQRRLLTDLLHAGLSAAGRERIPNEYYSRWPGVHAMKVLVCGDPRRPPYQVILSGAHLNLRIGGASREGAAFGGPLVYGDQHGDGVPGLPGNLYRFQLDTATRLFRGLTSEQQRLALLPTSPVQTAIQLQAPEGHFPGAPVSALSSENRALARELISGILSTWPDDDAAYAWSCIDHNGGPEALFLSYYADSDPGRRGAPQNVRLEGPAAVLYFRGDPHVHAFLSVAMDPSAPLGVGALVGNNPAPLEGAAVQRFFEAAMRDQLGADLAFYDPDDVAGRLRAGPVREGDLYALESWQNATARVEIKGANLGPSLVASLRAAGKALEPRRTYAVATSSHIAGYEMELIGHPEAVTPGPLLREVLIAHARQRGFPDHG